MNRFCLAALFLFGALSSIAAPPSWSLMPWPKKIEAAGAPLRLDSDFRVEFPAAPPPRLQRAARRFLSQLSIETGIPITSSHTTRLVIECCARPDGPDRLGDDESYTLDVSATQAGLKSATVIGAMRGLQTLLQLARPDAHGFAIGAVHIEDSPRFPWRGLLLDVTSHFFPVPVIKRNLDAMEAIPSPPARHPRAASGWRPYRLRLDSQVADGRAEYAPLEFRTAVCFIEVYA